MTSLVDEHLEKIQLHLNDEDKTSWNYINGANLLELEELKKNYPECPTLLLKLLSKVDGTYHREFTNGTVSICVLNSDVGEEFGYYLLSCLQIIEEKHYHKSIDEIYGGYIGQDEIISIDPRIDANIPMDKRLCFAHCMNNGGSSILYIDFDPTESGTAGQIIRFLHDPDSYVVLADSFEEYLASVVASDYEFMSWD